MNTAALGLLLHGLSQRRCGVEVHAELPLPALAPTQLLLPPGLAAGAAAAAAIAHAAAHLRHSPPARDARGRQPMALAVLSAVEDARAERLLVQDFPGVRRWFAAGLPRTAPEGLGFAALMDRLDRALADPAVHDGHHWVQRAQQGFWALPADAGPQAFAELALRLANTLGQMRVPFDRQYRPGSAYRDDHSYLWDHGRSADSAPLPAAQRGAAGRAAPGDGSVLHETCYAEWHEKLGLWRTGWCRVQERAVARAVTGAPLAALRRARQHPRPQAEGELLDLQAAVAARVQQRRGLSWDARLFLHPARTPTPASVLLLLDLSQSTLACWGTPPLSVHAAQKQAALWLAAQLLDQGARVAVHGFSSNTRAAVAYWRAQDFDQPLDAAAIAGLTARHSTRLGAALRHAHHLLAAQAGRRSLLVLTDGQPWDIDVFDAAHLQHDARRAVAQLRADGLRVRCLGFDAMAADALHAIFGSDGVCILDATRPLQAGLAGLAGLGEGTLIA